MQQLLSQVEKTSTPSKVPEVIIRGLIAHGFSDRTVERMIDLFVEGMVEVFCTQKSGLNKNESRNRAIFFVIRELLRQKHVDRAIEWEKAITPTMTKKVARTLIIHNRNMRNSLDGIIAASNQISSDEDRRNFLGEQAKRFALEGEVEQAIALVGAPPCNAPQHISEVDQLFVFIANTFSSKQLIEPTMKALRAISEDSPQKRELLFRIIDKWAASGLFIESTEIVELLPNSQDRESACACIVKPLAEQLIKNRKVKQAMAILSESLSYLKKLKEIRNSMTYRLKPVDWFWA